jgi:hypothetical protein
MNVVAPGITLEDYNNGKAKPIDLFEGRIKHWILSYAKHLAHDYEEKQNAGIAVLILTAAIIQPLGAVLPPPKGRKSNEAIFCNGFLHVFPEVPGAEDTWKLAERVCDLLRNGLFHESFIKPGLTLRFKDEPISEKDGVIYVDPVRFLDAVESAFSQVCNEIRNAEDGSPIREAFDSYWNQKATEQAKRITPTIKIESDSATTLSTSTLAPNPLDKIIKNM